MSNMCCHISGHNMKKQIAEGKFDPKKQITVSEQNLIDCSEDYGTIGCEGGMCCRLPLKSK